jgi:drug/metabolite transporter (DMT)-like permease
MPRKSHIDAFGVISLTAFALLLGFNQVVIKVTNDGLQPVFFAALRSVGGAILIYAWIRWRGIELTLPRNTWSAGILIGAVFSFEFICLFKALDLTTVTRTSVLLYTMPIWLALAAHVLIPEERLTRVKSIGLVLAFAGVVVALAARGEGAGGGALLGDFLAVLGAMAWACIALIVRLTALKSVRPEAQLLWQLVVSAPILLVAALFFGPLLREPSLIHWAGLGFPDRGGRLGRVPVLVLATDDLPRVFGRVLRVPVTHIRRWPRLAPAGRTGRPRHPGRTGAGLRGTCPDQPARAQVRARVCLSLTSRKRSA